MLLAFLVLAGGTFLHAQSGLHRAQIFPLVHDHVHGSTIVELFNGDLLTAWFQGDGERSADRVAIMGARLHKGQTRWSKPFLMADTPDFPDVNPVLFLDPGKRLWLVWYTVIAHQWDTSLLKYRISEDYAQPGAPLWKWQDVLHVKPGDAANYGIQHPDRFAKAVERKVNRYRHYLVKETGLSKQEMEVFHEWARKAVDMARGMNMVRRGYFLDDEGKRFEPPSDMGYPYFRRMGWQTRNKPTILSNGRILLPLYSDGFDFSLMATSDDSGKSWRFSEPLVALGSIQPAILEKTDGTLVSYMRDSGPPPKRLHISQSTNGGALWSPVRDSTLPNPGSGADAVRLGNGHWVLAYNDAEQGRRSLAISLSTNEGKSWDYTRHVERDERALDQATRSHYPAIIQGSDGGLHLTYSDHRRDQEEKPSKTIKYARFGEEWIKGGE